MPRVTKVESIGGYTLRVTFADGVVGDVDLSNELEGPMFEPLREKAFFALAFVPPDVSTVTWPNGADIAPEHLYSLIRVPA